MFGCSGVVSTALLMVVRTSSVHVCCLTYLEKFVLFVLKFGGLLLGVRFIEGDVRCGFNVHYRCCRGVGGFVIGYVRLSFDCAYIGLEIFVDPCSK